MAPLKTDLTITRLAESPPPADDLTNFRVGGGEPSYRQAPRGRGLYEPGEPVPTPKDARAEALHLLKGMLDGMSDGEVQNFVATLRSRRGVGR